MTRATLRGVPAAPGTGIASAFLFPSLAFQVSGAAAGQADPDEQKALFAQACDGIRPELLAAEEATAPGCLTAMLSDHLFRGSVIDRIDAGMTAADAVVQTTNDLIVIYGELPDPALRNRADYADAVGRRLFRRLHGLPTPVFRPGSPVVLVTDEMSPFDVARLHPASVAGIVAERGGATSHFAIIAKQLGIPVVTGIERALEAIGEGECCICDGTSGTVWASPDDATLAAARRQLAEIDREREELAALGSPRTATRDGRLIHLWGNIAGPDDIQPVLDAGGTGVGLFRTEFVFIGDEEPSEERQAAVYADVLRQTPGPVIMRTVEAGGDKSLPYLDMGREENPNLGWQGLRMCLDMEEFFLVQLRAMIRASSEGELWIMFPFVSALWELRRCRELVARAHREVEAGGVRPGRYKVGIMVEVPSAALLAEEYLRDFDFCSIGTNDLTQFTLAADRMNPRVARWYEPFHPAVVRLIAMTARAARKARKPIGMAGDMASDPLFIPVLVGLGFDILSATAPRIGKVKKTILSLDSSDAREIARAVLAMSDAETIRGFLQEKQRELSG
jgi:phosphotransferase system enzyme I (PtsI)